jgi:hypothetical protein
MHKTVQFLIQAFIDGADRRGAKFMTAELFGDGFDFAGTDPLMYISARAPTKAFSLRW